MSDEAEQSAAQPEQHFWASHYAKEAQQSQDYAALAARIEQDLRTNPRYDEFFAPYQPAVRESFVREYVTQKMFWVRFGNFYERHLTGRLTQFEEEAYLRLWDIQQKKLFDLQCQWRAELVQVPGVEVSCDFEDLACRIENCTVISPISEDELALYLRFIEQADYQEDIQDRGGHRFGWQNYDDVQAAYADEDDEEASWLDEEVAPWYFYHNQHTGQDRLLQLPDIRGQKEKRYLDAWRADNRATHEAAQQTAPPPPPADPRPSYVGYEESKAMRDEFARQFESAQVNRQREAYQAANPPSEYEDEELERMLDFLGDLEETVPIEAGPDWRKAVIQAAYALRKRKLLLNLPLAFRAYRQRLEWGITQPPTSDDESYHLSPMIRKGILTGRKLLGEPENFDF